MRKHGHGKTNGLSNTSGLPRLRAGMVACIKRFRDGRHFGVQACPSACCNRPGDRGSTAEPLESRIFNRFGNRQSCRFRRCYERANVRIYLLKGSALKLPPPILCPPVRMRIPPLEARFCCTEKLSHSFLRGGEDEGRAGRIIQFQLRIALFTSVFAISTL